MAFRFSLIPKSEDFYALFIALAAELRIGGGLLEEMLMRDPAVWDKAEEICEVEHKCDTLTHQIIQRLNTTFVTPIDREDIHALASSLDDVVDTIEYISRRVLLYRVEHATDDAKRMTDVLVRLTKSLEIAVNALEKDGQRVLQECITIHSLENEGDTCHHNAVERLFVEERDPIRLIKYKELYERLERAIDHCEDVSNVLEAIVLKNA